jgi:transcriptional regulator with XRE-family HTH domain
MVGNNLKKIRINQTKFSQQDIADYLGIDRNTVSAWENGKSDIKSEYIPRIAEFLKVEIMDLFDSKSITIGHNKNIGKENSLLNGAIIIVTDKTLLNDIIEKIEIHKSRIDNNKK